VKESRDADLLRFRYDRRIGYTGEYYDLRLWTAAPYGSSDIETVAVGEAQIQQAGIRTVLGDGRDAIGSTRSDGQYLMTACLESGREGLAQNAVVVTDDK
jgi:hypothetical protein